MKPKLICLERSQLNDYESAASHYQIFGQTLIQDEEARENAYLSSYIYMLGPKPENGQKLK